MTQKLLEFARAGIEAHLKGTPPPRLSPLHPPQACFVSLKIKGRLRGCIGTLRPVKKNLEDEVIANAVSAATRDPRFAPMTLEELPQADISIDLLSRPEPIPEKTLLNPAHYGVIVIAGDRQGVLLPDLPGINSVEKQLEIALEKADISPAEPYSLMRFTVERI